MKSSSLLFNAVGLSAECVKTTPRSTVNQIPFILPGKLTSLHPEFVLWLHITSCLRQENIYRKMQPGPCRAFPHTTTRRSDVPTPACCPGTLAGSEVRCFKHPHPHLTFLDFSLWCVRTHIWQRGTLKCPRHWTIWGVGIQVSSTNNCWYEQRCSSTS